MQVKKPTAKNLLQGQRAEELARSHLEAKGYKFVTQNFSCKLGEIDLIFLDGNQVVFVEVKARKSILFGYPQEFVTKSKLGKVVRSSQLYLQTNSHLPQFARVDVVGITGDLDNPEIVHLENVTL